MPEYSIIGVISALVGLFLAVGVPIINLIKVMTELTVGVRGLQADMAQLGLDSKKEHEALWVHNDEQDKTLNSHETRIQLMEKK